MNERQPRDISAIIQKLSQGERPLDKFLGGCIAEMDGSGQYGTAIVSGTQDPNEKRFISLLRMVVFRQREIRSIILTFEHNKGAEKRMLDHLIRLTNDLPTDRSAMRPLAAAASRSVQQAGLMTLAAMQINTSVDTGNEIVEVIYPKPYMNLMPVPEDNKRDVAFGLAVHYLKNVPYGKGNINIRVPSH